MTDWLFRLLKGALIGVGAILPGISGGVLCVVLGVYRRIMAFLAHPLRRLKDDFPWLLPILIGFAAGVVLLARVVGWLFANWETPATWLFIGLVAGTLPSLYREAGKQGRSPGAWVALALGALLMGGWMLLLSGTAATAATPSMPWWLLCGVLWGIGLLVPGMSPSSFFIFFGLYQPMSEGIGALDLSVLVPLGIGMVLTIALLARGINALLARAYPIVMHAILGIVVASTVAILPLNSLTGIGPITLYIACLIIGCAIALTMAHLETKLEKGGGDADEPVD